MGTNKTASASVAAHGLTPPPRVFCVFTPKQLFVGRKTTLTIQVTRHGKAI